MSEIVIVGGGPAGLTLGCYLSQADIRCTVLERAHHPRPHVGESLMPATVRIFDEIGFLPIMEAGGFPHSGGVVYHPADGSSVEVGYAEFPQEGIGQEYTYHVDRSKLDLLLMKHAESSGCRIVQGATVTDVLFDAAGAARGVRAGVANQSLEIPAQIVVDAGGRSTKIGRQLELRRDHPILDQFALHAWFVDVDRGKRKTASYTHVFFVPEVRGWIWQAPIDGDITSIGLVADRTVYQDSGLDVEDFFFQGLRSHPGTVKASEKAERINDLKGEVNYSYGLERVCGDGWLAIGDAAQFVDPVFSSGVSVAMHTARYAAERIVTAVESGDFSRATLVPYEQRMFAGAATWAEFVRLFYESPSTFMRFLQDPDYRPLLLGLLQGEVDDPAEASVLEAMQASIDSTGTPE